MKINIHTNKATTNIFGLHTQPRKITRYTNKLKLEWGGGGGGGKEKEPRFVHHAKFHCIMTTLIKLFKIEFERGGMEKSPENRHKFSSKGVAMVIHFGPNGSKQFLERYF